MPSGETEKTMIAEDVEIVGSVKCASSLHVAGKLNGDLVCTGNAVIGETANVKGNITAECASVMGQVNGNIAARDRIDLKATARVNGDIKAKRLTVEDGVTFIGKSEVNPSGAVPGRPAGTEPKPQTTEGVQNIEESGRREDAEAKGKPAGLFARK